MLTHAAMAVRHGTLMVALVMGGSFVACGKGTADVTDPGPVDPGPTPGASFESRWSTASGSSLEAITDGGSWPILACGTFAHDVLNVVASNTVGFTETPHVLRVQMRGAGPCGMLQRNGVVPASTTHWGRFYVRNDDQGSSNTHPVAYHNVHGSDPIQASPFQRFATMGAGQWQMGVGTGGGWPTNRFYSPVLTNQVWYRYEWEMRYLTATTFRFFPRIFTVDGTTPLYDEDDFRDENGQTLAHWYANGGFTALGGDGPSGEAEQLARNFGMGNEGPATAADTRGYWYYAKFALSTEGWIGQ
jgi:hypothetical protein